MPGRRPRRRVRRPQPDTPRTDRRRTATRPPLERRLATVHRPVDLLVNNARAGQHGRFVEQLAETAPAHLALVCSRAPTHGLVPAMSSGVAAPREPGLQPRFPARPTMVRPPRSLASARVGPCGNDDARRGVAGNYPQTTSGSSLPPSRAGPATIPASDHVRDWRLMCPTGVLPAATSGLARRARWFTAGPALAAQSSATPMRVRTAGAPLVARSVRAIHPDSARRHA